MSAIGRLYVAALPIIRTHFVAAWFFDAGALEFKKWAGIRRRIIERDFFAGFDMPQCDECDLT